MSVPATEDNKNLPTQQEPDAGSGQDQVKNHASGYVFEVGDFNQLQRFAILGCEGGTYYAMEEKLERENVESLDRLIAAGKGVDAVNLLREISVNRRSIKQKSLLYAYAILCRCNDAETKKAAYDALSDVCRIPTHLFMFIGFCETVSTGSGWGRAHKRAVANWYLNFEKEPTYLMYLITKYKNREKWTHKDVVRLSHAHSKADNAVDPVAFILRYIARGLEEARNYYMPNFPNTPSTPSTLEHISSLAGMYEEAAVCTNAERVCELITEHKLSWEHCPSELLRSVAVWQALLPHMPIEALIRNLGKMTNIGLFQSGSNDEQLVLTKIGKINSPGNINDERDEEEGDEAGKSMKNFLHPFKILLAWATYKTGHGDKGKLSWVPNRKIVDALDSAFYKAFSAVHPTGKRFYLAVDVSGSMSSNILGSKNMTCAMAAAAMMMVTVRTESKTIIKGFSDHLVDIGIRRDDKLDLVMKKVDNVTMGGTDCALPMIDAQESRMKDIDTFIVYTDNETWHGKVHPREALVQYRKYTGNQNVKLIVCGMASNKFSIADPKDTKMLDICGFDSAAPKVISDFVEGKI